MSDLVTIIKLAAVDSSNVGRCSDPAAVRSRRARRLLMIKKKKKRSYPGGMLAKSSATPHPIDLFNQVVHRGAQGLNTSPSFLGRFQAGLQRKYPNIADSASRAEGGAGPEQTQGSGFWGKLWSGDYGSAVDDKLKAYEGMSTGRKLLHNVGSGANAAAAATGIGAAKSLAGGAIRQGAKTLAGRTSGLFFAGEQAQQESAPGFTQSLAMLPATMMANRQDRQTASTQQNQRMRQLVGRGMHDVARTTYPTEYANWNSGQTPASMGIYGSNWTGSKM